jgi:hypothetical protein
MNFKDWNKTMLSEDAEFKHLNIEQKWEQLKKQEIKTNLCQHGKHMSERCAECQKLLRSEPRNYRQG